MRRRYRKRVDRPVIAVRLALDTDGLVYRKWGGEQRAKAGDWILDADGDVYTVDHESFIHTYRAVAPGMYVKTTPVWAERAHDAGTVKTKEGRTQYSGGHFLVSNHDDGSDAYAIDATTFESLYELDEN